MAESRANTEAARAERAETDTADTRQQLDAVRADLDRARDTAADLRGSVATLTAERDGAREQLRTAIVTWIERTYHRRRRQRRLGRLTPIEYETMMNPAAALAA